MKVKVIAILEKLLAIETLEYYDSNELFALEHNERQELKLTMLKLALESINQTIEVDNVLEDIPF